MWPARPLSCWTQVEQHYQTSMGHARTEAVRPCPRSCVWCVEKPVMEILEVADQSCWRFQICRQGVFFSSRAFFTDRAFRQMMCEVSCRSRQLLRPGVMKLCQPRLRQPPGCPHHPQRHDARPDKDIRAVREVVRPEPDSRAEPSIFLTQCSNLVSIIKLR